MRVVGLSACASDVGLARVNGVAGAAGVVGVAGLNAAASAFAAASAVGLWLPSMLALLLR